jgi:PKD repeat protein
MKTLCLHSFRILVLISLWFLIPEINAQMLADFETPGTSPAFYAEGATAIVANPDKTGLNPSDSVGYYNKIDGNWHFVNLEFPDTVRIRYSNTLTFKLRTTTQGRIFAKFYNGTEVVIENWCPSWNFRPAPNSWVECTMDMTDAMGKQFTRLQLAACVDNTAEADVWFDDVMLSNPDAGDGIPVLLFSPSQISLPPGQELILDASESYDFDGEIVVYHWDLGDGTTGSGKIFSHTYDKDSVFQVKLTITDNDGKSATGEERIFVIHPAHKLSRPHLVTPEPLTNHKIELIFQSRDVYSNVYDPDQVRIDAVIGYPNGDTSVVPCFFQVPVTYENLEWLADTVHQSWMLRFMSDQPGDHTLRFMVEDTSGKWSSEPFPVEVRQGTSKGRIIQDTVNRQYYRHTTGEPFYPLGINVGWNTMENYTQILNNLSGGGANVFRYWQTPFNWQALEWSEDYYYNYEGLGRYNQEAAARNDSLMELCDSLDLYMQLCILQHGQFSENVDAMWDTNPYNIDNGGYVERAEEYFYSEDCRMQTRKLLRYIVARWAYSRNLFAWEFFNEVQFTGNHNNQSELWFPGVVSWHSEMSRYMESIDPYDHLLTTSASEEQLATLDTISALDNLQYHVYDEEATLLNTQVGLDKRFLNDLGHTSIINGEYGTRNEADTPFDMQRNAIWNGIMTQVPRYMWVWEHYLDPVWANLFSMPSHFLSEEDLASHEQLAPFSFQASHPAKTLRSLGLSGDALFMGYLYDPAYDSNISGLTITLTDIPVGNYTISYWLPVSDQVMVSDSVAIIKGSYTLEVPSFSKGIAFKVKYHSLYTLPLANAGPDTTVAVGTVATLSGKASTDPGADTLLFRWSLVESPEGSSFRLADSSAMEIEVLADLSGIYLMSLVVSNGKDTSVADEVVVRGSLPPVALAGPDSTVSVDEMYVRLDGSGSFDPDGDPLMYAWVLLSAPDESEKLIYEEDSHQVILKTDAVGQFLLGLTVSDGTSMSDPDTVMVTVQAHGTGLRSRLDAATVSLFPNPTNGKVYLRSPEGKGIERIEVLDLQGRILGAIDTPSTQSEFILDLGQYTVTGSPLILRISGHGFNEYQPVIYQH